MMTSKESSIINGDSPLPIPRQFARWLGWNEAGILQQLHYHTEQEHGQVLDGLRWIRMSETDWMEEIPLDEKAIQRAIVNLGSDGLIISRTFKGRCKWYAILYGAVADLAGPVERITQKSAKRKKASAARKDFTPKEQNVPIVINPIDAGSSGDYANQKEQSVPILKEQNGPMDRNKMGGVWEQNVPLQESLQESRQDTTPNGVGDKSPPPESDKVPGGDKPKKQLMGTFLAETGLKMPHRKSDVGFWWSAIGEIYKLVDNDVGLGSDIIRRAVKRMKGDKLTISGPNSIVNICRPLLANSNGPPAQISKEIQRLLDEDKTQIYNPLDRSAWLWPWLW